MNPLKGIVTQLLFGSNGNLDWVRMDSDHLECSTTKETTIAIKIKNGSVIQSNCIP